MCGTIQVNEVFIEKLHMIMMYISVKQSSMYIDQASYKI
jgi:hypothetical protein